MNEDDIMLNDPNKVEMDLYLGGKPGCAMVQAVREYRARVGRTGLAETVMLFRFWRDMIKEYTQ